ncbi:MAG: GYF domain-containing protein [Muribaculaceae bacterium]|nr:GYF domain-containing protein [Muribaculaceae bacterium]
MEKEYYIVVDDNRVGPLSLTQLSERGIEPSTLVWTAGMADWTRADCVPELASLLAARTRIDEQESAFGSYARPSEQSAGNFQPYREPRNYDAFNNGVNQGGGNFNPPTNWKTLAIVATVAGFIFSCIGGIIGIIAWVNANKAENAMRFGDDFTAQSAWSTCKTLCIVSFILTGIGLIFNILTIFNIISLSQFHI